MPGGRRTAKSSTFKHHPHSSDDRHNHEVPTQPQVPPPKHVPLPEIPTSSELSFEVDIFMFCILAMCSQYLNLYRSVFWLPYSHTESTLNYYLIDPYVVAFNLIIVGRRLPLCLLKQVCFFCFPTSFHSVCIMCIRVIVMASFIPSIAWCSYNIFLQHGTLSIFCLGYPTVVYLILFGPSIVELLELKDVAMEKNSGSKTKGSGARGATYAINHVCSMSADAVREEVEMLKTDFNARLKQVLFNSLLVAYYLSFVPCCFAQSALYYEISWVGQNIGFVWLSCFTMYVVFCFPPRYCDVLHRAALHLGRWQKLEVKTTHLPCNAWSDSILWNQGVLVKYSKELYKAEGIANAAEPGNHTHSRFYAVFSNPTGALSTLLALQLMLMVIQIVVLIRSSDWNHILSVELLMFLNFKTLFKIARQYLVLRRIYHEEKVLMLKFSN